MRFMPPIPRLLAPLSTLLLLIGCGGSSPTAPAPLQQCRTLMVFGEEASYVARTEAEQEFRGTLEFRNLPATPNGRDHRYFLTNMPVYSGGSFTEPLFANAAGSDITIRGKLVDVGFGPEIWAATLSTCK
jgi:hypothetical protein